MSSPSSFHDAESYEYGQWDPFEEDVSSEQQTQLQEDKLGFCQLTDWDEKRTYNEHPPIYIHYSVEWRVRVNNRELSKDTEQDLVLAPAAYWRLFLNPKLEKVLLCKMLAKKRTVKSEDTKIVITVTQRLERDVTKRFDNTDIDWSVIERQLILWADLYRAGRKLRVNISFNYNYVETGQPSAMSSRNTDKRGPSTTQRMLTERALQLDAEQESSGEPSIWRDIYSLMRCPGPPCHLGPHCWRDPVGKKHYKLKTHHLKSLIRHVEQGYELQTHDDVPDEIRQQLYAEEQQRLGRRHKSPTTSAANFPPINITNMLPPQSYQPPLASLPAEIPALDMPSIPTSVNRLNIPGPLDEAVEEYCAWQQSRFTKPKVKEEYQKACNIIIEDCMTLELIYRDPNPKYLMDRGIKRGVAEHIVGDIDEWVQNHKRARTEE